MMSVLLGNIWQMEGIKLTNLISNAETATTGWQMLALFGIFLALPGYLNLLSFFPERDPGAEIPE